VYILRLPLQVAEEEAAAAATGLERGGSNDATTPMSISAMLHLRARGGMPCAAATAVGQRTLKSSGVPDVANLLSATKTKSAAFGQSMTIGSALQHSR
jgi:hypothetical protein